MEAEPPQVGALVGLEDLRIAGPRPGGEEVVDPLVDRSGTRRPERRLRHQPRRRHAPRLRGSGRRLLRVQ